MGSVGGQSAGGCDLTRQRELCREPQTRDGRSSHCRPAADVPLSPSPSVLRSTSLPPPPPVSSSPVTATHSFTIRFFFYPLQMQNAANTKAPCGPAPTLRYIRLC